ncbi:LUD domain-containing protein [Marinifilum sp. D737]|uniref:LUD domain-containing protein n=1 Tax=Marinifilum sp. D737 TaxID=2969628 RepID=UPI002275EF56|nr:LUD domain-containing protein [Marinifilum sp. D737]MCY1633975.1 LUD domain-containing protein [Marinifilum sp. D737]
MEVRTFTQKQNLFSTENRRDLLDSFLANSNQLGNDSLKVDQELFIEAASKENVQFEFIRLNSIDLHKKSFEISNAKNAIIEAEYAIADSGKLIIDTQDSDQLLTIFLAETLHIIVPSSKILLSMDDLELIKGKKAIDVGRGIASLTSSGSNKGLSFSSKLIKTLVYVIEDL